VGVAQVVYHLSGMRDALGSTTSTKK
jgi:hypothetical protein